VPSLIFFHPELNPSQSERAIEVQASRLQAHPDQGKASRRDASATQELPSICLLTFLRDKIAGMDAEKNISQKMQNVTMRATTAARWPIIVDSNLAFILIALLYPSPARGV